MKRILAFVLAALLLTSFAACGVVDTESAEGAGGIGGGIFTPDLNFGGSDEQEETQGLQPVAFEEIVAVDNEHCAIKITGIEEDSLWGYSISAQLENKSEDKTFMFSLDSCSVNGVEVAPLFASEVAAGKKSVESISIAEDDLKNNGITQYTDICLSLRVYDSDDWLAEDVGSTTVHIYPYGLDNATAFTREPKAEDILLVDNDKVSVTVTGFREDALWGYTMDLYIVNKTDTTIMLSVDDASVNGFMADPFFATTVSPGNVAFSSASWSDTELEKANITEVENIEFVLRVYDNENWFGDDFANEQIKLEP